MIRSLRGRAPLAVLGLAALAACGGNDDDSGSPSQLTYDAEIRRTAMGVPHIKADTWAGLGYGYGYAQAEDNLCTMADSFLTYRGERSRHFGAQATLKADGTVGMPVNLESDFFHRHVITDARVQAMTDAQPTELRDLVTGFVAGYNRHLRDYQAKPGNAHAECRGAAWLTPIQESDIYRRLYQTNLAGGYSNFLANITSAAPPASGTASAMRQGVLRMAALGNLAPPAKAGLPAGVVATAAAGDRAGVAPIAPADRLVANAITLNVGGDSGVGSNMFGFGTAATGTDSPLLFGNPHWYWRGPDRFYQAQLTIPGTLNVGGTSFLGVPVILIGYNDNIAWSHTVSTARRFGFYELNLVPGQPTQYLRDGKAVPMTANTIAVDVRQADGSVSPVTRTLYSSEYGPLVNLGPLNPALAWTGATAFAIRDINADNYRTFRNWMRWNRAGSLEEFKAIQRQEAAIPWVNTVAVGRGSAQAWYADIGAVPNVSDDQLANCTTPRGKAVAAALPRVPFLDGSRSACDWQTDPDSAQTGAIGSGRLPTLERRDYVANMNDSYWLSNPAAPLTGFPAIMGPAGTEAVSLRTRLGHKIAQDRLAGADGQAGRTASVDTIQTVVLNNRVLSAELFKDQALGIVCTNPAQAAAVQACAALRAWDNTGEATARGAHLWDAFWTRASALGAANLYNIPFSPADPVNTPRDLKASAAPALTQAFAAAVQAIGTSGYAFDAPRGDYLYATRGDRIPLYGGCGSVGYFTIACPEVPVGDPTYQGMDGNPNGNSYMQIVTFPASGVQARTFLTFSQSDDPASPHYGDYTRAYGRKQWVRVPFTEGEITGDAGYRTVRVGE